MRLLAAPDYNGRALDLCVLLSPDSEASKVEPAQHRSIGHAAVRGTLHAWMGHASGFALRLGVSVVLARMVAPASFGAYALALAYAEIAAIAGAFSFPQAIVQLGEGRRHLFGTALRLTLLGSFAVFALAFVVSPLLAAWHDAAVARVFVVLSAVNVVTGVSQCLESALQRGFHYGRLSALRVGATAVGAGSAVVAAHSGLGLTALVVRDAVPIFVTAATLAVALRRPLAGSLGWDGATAREIGSLGKGLFAVRGLEVLYYRVDQLVIGHVLGDRELGFYAQAKYLAALPSAGLGPATQLVGLRAFSAVREDPGRLQRGYLLLQYVVGRLMVPFAVAALVFPAPVVRLLWGPAWEPTAAVLPYLAAWMLVHPFFDNAKTLLVALRSWRVVGGALLIDAAFVAATTVPAVVALGIPGAGLAVSLAHIAAMGALHLGIRRRFDVPENVYFGAVAAAALSVLAAWGARSLAAPLGPGMSLLVSAATAAAAIPAALLLLEGKRLLEETRFLLDRLRAPSRP